MQAGNDETTPRAPSHHSNFGQDEVNYTDEERGLGLRSVTVHRDSARSLIGSNGHSEGGQSSTTDVEDETELQTRPNSLAEATSGSGNFIKRKTSQLLQAVSGTSKVETPLSSQLVALVDAYASSDIASSLRAEIDSLAASANQNDSRPTDPAQLPDVAVESTLLRGRQRASWTTQFRILSGRAFKNLYRDPALLAAHYLSSVAIAGMWNYLGILDMHSVSTSHLWFIVPKCSVRCSNADIKGPCSRVHGIAMTCQDFKIDWVRSESLNATLAPFDLSYFCHVAQAYSSFHSHSLAFPACLALDYSPMSVFCL
jgi:hypothetical protein